ncbi:rab proteins geranylgeranyltransferase component A 1 [Engraulis encrasicolus]|uniref:rab proteins geranylgeranyltransferase component A 1 n=1 Tax=Engraulis encrasicolus TaxID=184585 RepID=UPI002FD10BCD
MASDNLPSEFDVVILGTGLTESIVASACSRVGQRVLHVDRRNYYSSKWAGFNFNSLLSWIEEHKAQPGSQSKEEEEEEVEWRSKVEDGEEALPISADESFISDLEVFCYASLEEEEEEEEEKEVAKEDKQLTETAPPSAEETKGEEEEGVVSPDGTQETSTGSETQQCSQNNEASETQEEEGTAKQEATQSGDAEEKDEQQQQQQQEEDKSTKEEEKKKKKKKITYPTLLKEGRRFNIDLVSKLIYSRGSLVDLLIQSKVSRYTEFKIATRVLTYRAGRVEQVPCSRADVFASKQLTMVEKRMLMKFLTFCMDFESHPEEYQDSADSLFSDFLKTKKLTENLQHFVLHSIAMVTKESCRTADGLRATRHFLQCLGRYGNTPFLFPLYGLGEIPQCFCRMSAVFGGIYCLRHSVAALVVDKESNRCKAVIDTHGQRIGCTHFVVEDGFMVDQWKKKKEDQQQRISRAVLITDRSVLPADSDQQISLLTVPPLEAGGPSVRVVELCSSSMTCMPGTYLVHLTCASRGTARADLEPLVTDMFSVPPAVGGAGAEAAANAEGDDGGKTDERSGEGRPTVLWAMYFNMLDTSAMDLAADADLPGNVHLCAGPDVGLGCDYSVKLAETVFRQILPEEEFCPPAPDPEDIIYEGGEAPQGEGAGFEETPKTEGGTEGEAEAGEGQPESEKETAEEESPSQDAPKETGGQEAEVDTSPSEE